jgi:uncharacterized protein YfdQ (DUF2303 family)
MEPVQKSEAEAVAEIVRRNLSDLPLIKASETGVSLIAHPAGHTRTLESLERFEALPRRKRAVVVVGDHSSFIDYVARHMEAGTLIFASITEQGGSFKAILDYHVANHTPGDDKATASADPLGDPNGSRWGNHVCTYIAEHTAEWKRWIQLSGRPQTQTAMALFIEDNIFDIIEPAPAVMLEMVKSLEATQGVAFKSAIRLDNGDRKLEYNHQTVAKAGQAGEIEIPTRFKLRFGVFVNGPVYDIDCRFRYKIDGGALQMAFEIERPHKLIDLALTDARTAIVQTLRLPVLLGGASGLGV